jgi:hypothetical protein
VRELFGAVGLQEGGVQIATAFALEAKMGDRTLILERWNSVRRHGLPFAVNHRSNLPWWIQGREGISTPVRRGAETPGMQGT